MRERARLERVFETHTDAWEAVGLAAEVRRREVRRARTRAIVLLPVLAGVIVAYALRKAALRSLRGLAGADHGRARDRDPGLDHRARRRPCSRSHLLRRLDPATARSVGFLIRLATIAVTLLVALQIAQVSASALLAGSAFTAVIIGLAAQQTLGNLFAGLVLVGARPFLVGERLRLQAGGLAGETEGVVSSLGLLYTTLARGEDRIMVPNSVVLCAAVVPVREPESVDVRVRLGARMRPTHVQAILDEKVTTPTRDALRVLLGEVDGDAIVVRIRLRRTTHAMAPPSQTRSSQR